MDEREKKLNDLLDNLNDKLDKALALKARQQMGMTIEEAHEILCKGLVNAPSEHEWCIAFRIAIDTMRKYQKIEQAYSAYLETMNPDTLADLISTII